METLSDDKLCVYTLEDQTARLTYHVFVNTEYGSFEFFVDTVSAEILFCNEDVVYMQKEFTFPGQTDTHTFTAESSQEYNEMYYLSDSGTKVTIHIPSNGHDYDWYYDGNADIVRWKDGENPDKSAVDAIYNISSVYRYYKGTFGRDSFLIRKRILMSMFIPLDIETGVDKMLIMSITLILEITKRPNNINYAKV